MLSLAPLVITLMNIREKFLLKNMREIKRTVGTTVHA
jgi:hypothetical protein